MKYIFVLKVYQKVYQLEGIRRFHKIKSVLKHSLVTLTKTLHFSTLIPNLHPIK